MTRISLGPLRATRFISVITFWDIHWYSTYIYLCLHIRIYYITSTKYSRLPFSPLVPLGPTGTPPEAQLNTCIHIYIPLHAYIYTHIMHLSSFAILAQACLSIQTGSPPYKSFPTHPLPNQIIFSIYFWFDGSTISGGNYFRHTKVFLSYIRLRRRRIIPKVTFSRDFIEDPFPHLNG